MGNRGKRAAAGIALSVLGALALNGCAEGAGTNEPAAPDEKVELTIWAWHANLQPALDLWNEQNPNTQISLETLPPDLTTAYQKIFASVTAGTAADILPVEYMAMPNFIAEGVLADLGDLVADQESEYMESAWSQVLVDGSPFALPGDIGPMGMFYNAAALAEHGIGVPTTWEEFEQAGLKLRDLTNGEVFIGAIPVAPGHFAGLSWQAGAQWWSRDGDAWAVDIDSAATQMVAETWQRMVDEGIVHVWANETVGQQMVAEGRLVTVINPSWWAPNLLAMDLPEGTFGVTTLPQWDPSAPASGNSGGTSWGVSASSQHRERAVEFIKWFTQSAEAYSAVNDETSFSFPASHTQIEVAGQRTTPFVTVDGTGDVFGVFGQSAEWVSDHWQWSPTTIATLASLEDELGRLAPGSDLVGGLSSLQSSAITHLTNQGFEVAQ